MSHTISKAGQALPKGANDFGKSSGACIAVVRGHEKVEPNLRRVDRPTRNVSDLQSKILFQAK
jgi:hypothetical protein